MAWRDANSGSPREMLRKAMDWRVQRLWPVSGLSLALIGNYPADSALRDYSRYVRIQARIQDASRRAREFDVIGVYRD